MVARGARSLTVTTGQAAANARLVGGPLRLCGWSFNTGPSSQTEFTPANPPAAQADTTVFTVTAGQQAQPVSLTFTLTTDATVGNRLVRVEIRDSGGNVVERIPCLTADPASTAGTISVYLGASGVGGAAGSTTAAMPNTVMQAGWTIHIVESGTIGAADQISAIVGIVVNVPNGAAATIFDGGQAIGFTAVLAGGIDSQPLMDYGIEVATQLSVQATAGSISGVLWYLLESDLTDYDSRA
jgi:hypothetical protein